MSFSKEWDETFAAGIHRNIWPWSDLISYVMRYARPTSAEFRVLEIGCGTGANIPFFQSLNVQYFAIEGSEYIVTKLWQKFLELKDHLVITILPKISLFPILLI
jgi:hypothetical protein